MWGLRVVERGVEGIREEDFVRGRKRDGKSDEYFYGGLGEFRIASDDGFLV